MFYTISFQNWQQLRKRKREIYEEEDSDVDSEASDDDKDMDVFGMDWAMGDGGPQGVGWGSTV